MAEKKQLTDLFRRKPKQARSEHTIDTIVDAAIHVLHDEGEKSLTTNRIAERSGFGIGTLYQYFPNKEAILTAIAQREVTRLKASIAKVLKDNDQSDPETATRALIHAFLHAFGGRHRARRAVVMMMSRQADLATLATLLRQMMDDLFAQIRWNDHFPADMTKMRFHVISRAVIGAVRLTLIENPDLLSSKEFEDELVRLVLVGSGIATKKA